jgi:hypothetical protein
MQLVTRPFAVNWSHYILSTSLVTGRVRKDAPDQACMLMLSRTNFDYHETYIVLFVGEKASLVDFGSILIVADQAGRAAGIYLQILVHL